MMEVKKTTCPFCLNGCTSGVVFDGYQYRMEYATDGPVNAGKLCARGNSASLVVDHPKRMAYPLLDGKVVTWDEANALVKEWRGKVKPEEIALVYSRGRSGSEVRRLHGLAKEIGTKYLACGHIEPENAFETRLAGVKNATLEQLEGAKAMLLVGDVFNTSPVAVRRIMDARYADRKNRLVVIDSIRTRQSGFAHLFIQVKPGTEPFALVAIGALLDQSLKADVDKLAGIAGVSRGQLEAAAKMIGSETPGFVGSAAHTGRVFYPVLHSLASQLVARAASKPFVGFRETGLPQGTTSFATLRKAMADGKVRMMFWTGGLYPYSYKEILPETNKVEFKVGTAIFVPDPPVDGLVFPLTAELEKDSSGGSYWGPVTRSATASPYSGTRDVADVFGLFGKAEEAKEAEAKPVEAAEVLAMADKASGVRLGGDGFLLMGEKKAIGLRGFYDPEETVLVNPADAAKLEVTGDNYLTIESPTARLDFQVHVTDGVPEGAVLVGTNVHRNRTLFPLTTDEISGDTSVSPVNVKVEKAAWVVEPPTVNIPDLGVL